MDYFENIIVQDSEVNPIEMLCVNDFDWEYIEKQKTIWTNERYLPRILVDSGVVKSTSEVRRNKPEYNITLPQNKYLEIKWGKRKFWILS